MTIASRFDFGDVVLVPFPFTDQKAAIAAFFGRIDSWDVHNDADHSYSGRHGRSGHQVALVARIDKDACSERQGILRRRLRRRAAIVLGRRVIEHDRL